MEQSIILTNRLVRFASASILSGINPRIPSSSRPLCVRFEVSSCTTSMNMWNVRQLVDLLCSLRFSNQYFCLFNSIWCRNCNNCIRLFHCGKKSTMSSSTYQAIVMYRESEARKLFTQAQWIVRFISAKNAATFWYGHFSSPFSATPRFERDIKIANNKLDLSEINHGLIRNNSCCLRWLTRSTVP